MNQLVFRTGGDWDTTTLNDNEGEVLASELFVELDAGRDEFGEPILGGVLQGYDLNAFLRLQADGAVQHPVFPGQLVLDCQHTGNQVLLEVGDFPNQIRVEHNGRDVTENIVSLFFRVDADANVIEGRIELYKADWLGLDEIICFDLL